MGLGLGVAGCVDPGPRGDDLALVVSWSIHGSDPVVDPELCADYRLLIVVEVKAVGGSRAALWEWARLCTDGGFDTRPCRILRADRLRYEGVAYLPEDREVARTVPVEVDSTFEGSDVVTVELAFDF